MSIKQYKTRQNILALKCLENANLIILSLDDNFVGS